MRKGLCASRTGLANKRRGSRGSSFRGPCPTPPAAQLPSYKGHPLFTLRKRKETLQTGCLQTELVPGPPRSHWSCNGFWGDTGLLGAAE